MAETFCLLPDGEPRNKTPIICHRRSIRWPRLHHRKGWCFPSWTFKGITNKMLNYGLRRLKTGEKAIFYHAVWAKQPHFMTETYPVSHHTIQWRLCHRNGWSFPFWTSKGTTNKMSLASQTKKQDKMTVVSPYWSETTASYDRVKNFKRVFSEGRYSGHLATSRKTVVQGFDKRESLWKRGGGGCGRKGKIFLQKGFLSPPKTFVWWGGCAKGVRSGRKQPPTR